MISNDVQYGTTKTLRAQFEEPARNSGRGLAGAKTKKLHQLEIEAAAGSGLRASKCVGSPVKTTRPGLQATAGTV